MENYIIVTTLDLEMLVVFLQTKRKIMQQLLPEMSQIGTQAEEHDKYRKRNELHKLRAAHETRHDNMINDCKASP